jgi:hypothetical protein
VGDDTDHAAGRQEVLADEKLHRTGVEQDPHERVQLDGASSR